MNEEDSLGRSKTATSPSCYHAEESPYPLALVRRRRTVDHESHSPKSRRGVGLETRSSSRAPTLLAAAVKHHVDLRIDEWFVSIVVHAYRQRQSLQVVATLPRLQFIESIHHRGSKILATMAETASSRTTCGKLPRRRPLPSPSPAWWSR